MHLLLAACLALQDPDWKKDNFAGPVPEEIVRSKNGHLELVNILGSRIPPIGSVRGVAFSQEGKYALSCSGTVKLWDMATGREMAGWKEPSGRFTCVLFSPDGKRALSTSDDGTVKVWGVPDGREVATWQIKVWTRMNNKVPLSIDAAALSPDGRSLLVSGGSYCIKMLDAESGKEIRSREGIWAHGVAFSPDGTRVLYAEDKGTLALVDAESLATIATWKGHKSIAFCVAFASDGKRAVSGSYDGTVRLWDVERGTPIATFEGHRDAVYSVAFSPDDRSVVSGSKDQSVRLWDIATGKETAAWEQPWSGRVGVVKGVAFCPDGKRAIWGGESGLMLWDVQRKTGMRLGERKGHHEFAVTCVDASQGGRRALSGSNDKTLKLWDVESGKEVATWSGHKNGVTSVAFSPDGKRALSGSGDETLKLWEVESGKEIATWTGHSETVRSVAFSPDGKRALSGSSDGMLKLWDVETGKEIATWKGHEREVASVAFSPNGNHALSAGKDRYSTITLWDVQRGKELWSQQGYKWEAMTSLTFGRDGKRVVSGDSAGHASILNAEDGREIATLNGHQKEIVGVALTPDGKRALSGSRDKTLKLWDVESGKEIDTIVVDGGPTSLAICGDLVVVGNANTTVTVYKLK